MRSELEADIAELVPEPVCRDLFVYRVTID
jgi:hypothetical protein